MSDCTEKLGLIPVSIDDVSDDRAAVIQELNGDSFNTM